MMRGVRAEAGALSSRWRLGAAALLAVFCSGCALGAAPKTLVEARDALDSANGAEAEALRPRLLAEARQHLARANAAYQENDLDVAGRYAQLALNRYALAQNLIAAGSARRSEVLLRRLDRQARQELVQWRARVAEMEQLRSMEGRIAVIQQQLDAARDRRPDPAFDAARQALLAANRAQSEAIQAGAATLAPVAYRQGTALMSAAVEALALQSYAEATQAARDADGRFSSALADSQRQEQARLAAGQAAAQQALAALSSGAGPVPSEPIADEDGYEVADGADAAPTQPTGQPAGGVAIAADGAAGGASGPPAPPAATVTLSPPDPATAMAAGAAARPAITSRQIVEDRLIELRLTIAAVVAQNGRVLCGPLIESAELVAKVAEDRLARADLERAFELSVRADERLRQCRAHPAYAPPSTLLGADSADNASVPGRAQQAANARARAATLQAQAQAEQVAASALAAKKQAAADAIQQAQALHAQKAAESAEELFVKRAGLQLASAEKWFDRKEYARAEQVAREVMRALAAKPPASGEPGLPTQPARAVDLSVSAVAPEPAATVAEPLPDGAPKLWRTAYDATIAALRKRDEVSAYLTDDTRPAFERGVQKLAAARSAYEAGSYAQARMHAQAAKAQFDAAVPAPTRAPRRAPAAVPAPTRAPRPAPPARRRGARSPSPAPDPALAPAPAPAAVFAADPPPAPVPPAPVPPAPVPPAPVPPAPVPPAPAIAVAPRIIVVAPAPTPVAADAPPAWNAAYQVVVRALILRDRARGMARDARGQDTVQRGSDYLDRSQRLWEAKKYAAAKQFALAAIDDFQSVIHRTPAPTPAAALREADPSPEQTQAALERADAALREANVVLQVCERDECDKRGFGELAQARELIHSADTQLKAGNHAYADRLARQAREQLVTLLAKPRPSAAPVAAPDLALKQDAQDARDEAEIQRKLCEARNCAGINQEGWLRAQYSLAAANSAIADGGFERAGRLARTATDGFKAIRAAEPSKPTFTIPEDVSTVARAGGQLYLTPAVSFANGSAIITKESRAALLDLAKVIGANKSQFTRINIVGYTDNRGNISLNRRLSKLRAEAVMKALVNAGVDQALLGAEGRGPDSPLADNGTAAGRSANRRVEFRIEQP